LVCFELNGSRLGACLHQKFAACTWIRDSQHLAIGGPTGVGESWLACSLGHKACREGFSVLYKRAPRLIADPATARGEGRLARLMASIERTRLLIIDDWGPEPFTADQRRGVREIVEDRYKRGSLLIISQVPISRWHEIGNPTIADAILDRIIHRAHRIELKGDSRLRQHTVATTEPLTNAKEK
jgi:DNA replication protein DnaC